MVDKIIIVVLVFLLNSCSCVEEQGEIEAGDRIEIVDAGEDASIKEAEISEQNKQSKMIDEVVEFWNLIFDDVGASRDDARRARMPEYAEIIVKYTEFFKHHPDYPLPQDDRIHLLLAYMMYKECSLYPRAIGRSHKEVGSFQLHGEALQGYTRKQVRNNTDLGIFLGIKWFAKEGIHKCNLDLDDWEFRDFLGPISVFGGGERRAIKHGRCITRWKYSKDRVNQTEILYERMLAQKQSM